MSLIRVLFFFLVTCFLAATLIVCGGGDGDNETTYYADADGDGFGDVNVSQVMDSTQAGWVLDSTDCDDDPSYGASINPSAAEICDDWTDNDCDDDIDCYDSAACGADPACTGCIDADSDGYYAVTLDCSGGNDCADADSTVNPGVNEDGDTLSACEDCDDMNSSIGGGTTEVCNNIDDDCDREVDEGDPGGGVSCDGADSDLCFEGTTSCVAGTLVCSDVSSSTMDECNGLDDDCDPASADGDEDPLFGVACDGADADQCEEGTYLCNGVMMACSDTTGDNVEECNGSDDDCDGMVDEEDSTGCTTYYLDSDGDGYGLASSTRCLCGPAGDYTTLTGGDCDDSDENVNPAATEVCNAVDDDCDSQTDEPGSADCVDYYLDNDDDDYGLTGDSQCLCSGSGSYSTLNDGDCDDSEPAVNPGAEETCNAVEDDCDSEVDEDGALGCTNYYADIDEDGFGDDAASVCACSQPSGYVTDNTDCYDNNALAYPTFNGWVDTNRGDGSFDYNCDDSLTYQYDRIGGCSGIGCSESNQSGWPGSVADCGVTRSYIDYCYTSWGTCYAEYGSRTQRCR